LWNVHGVCRILVATANPVDVLIAETEMGCAVIGCVDGFKTTEGSIEDEPARADRRKKLAEFGYKLG
jgi:adenosine/AMP kinase